MLERRLLVFVFYMMTSSVTPARHRRQGVLIDRPPTRRCRAAELCELRGFDVSVVVGIWRRTPALHGRRRLVLCVLVGLWRRGVFGLSGSTAAAARAAAVETAAGALCAHAAAAEEADDEGEEDDAADYDDCDDGPSGDEFSAGVESRAGKGSRDVLAVGFGHAGVPGRKRAFGVVERITAPEECRHDSSDDFVK